MADDDPASRSTPPPLPNGGGGQVGRRKPSAFRVGQMVPYIVPVPRQTFSHYPGLPVPGRVRVFEGTPHPCPYLPGRTSHSRAFWAERMDGSAYHLFLDAGFRRSGKVIYQPVCPGCRQCKQIRVPVASFEPTKSQRRCWRKNQDLVVTLGPPKPTDEKWDLYLRYVTKWHGKQKTEEDRESFESFLYDSPVDTAEYCYRDRAGRLLAVGICDICSESFSTVYLYHDPESADRSIGTFSALYEIEEARRLGIPHYYLGFWIEGCGTMHYKSTYRPNELLGSDGVWRPNDGLL